MTPCGKCSAPAHATLCSRCSDQLRANLTLLPWLSDELANAATKLTVLTVYPTRPPSADESPVPFNLAARDRYDELRTVCMRWVRDVADREGIDFLPVDGVPTDFIGPLPRFGQYHPGTGYIPDRRDRWRVPTNYIPTTRDLALWLRAHYLDIVNGEDAALCAYEIDNAVTAARRDINPRRLAYCGPCPTETGEVDEHDRPIPCGVAIWAEWDNERDKPAQFATCRRCRTEHEVQELLDAGFERAQDYLMTRVEILDVLESYGTPLSNNTFHKWKKAGRFRARGYKHGDRIVDYRIYNNDPPVYRLGDVRALMPRTREFDDAASARA